MANLFNSISSRRPRKNVFNLSHDVKLSANMGNLVPVLCQEIVPGDRFRVQSNTFVRVAPMLAPIMHRLNVHMHYFFVPNRLVWNEWEDFITGGREGNANPVFPRIRINGSTEATNLLGQGTLADYLGVGLGNNDGTSMTKPEDVSLLPFRAYQMIWNEYYRDQNLSPEINIPIDSGIVTAGQTGVDQLFTMRKRAWEKDYFTSALPWTQRGPEATIPIQGNAPVVYNNPDNRRQQLVNWNGLDLPTFKTDPELGTDSEDPGVSADITLRDRFGTVDPVQTSVNIDPNDTLYADLENATATTINELRRSIRLQEWLEKMARGGARYIEQIASHFGVTSSDARLQRPEFLGGGKSPIVISEVLQTSSTDSESPQANMAGHGISAGATNRFDRRFEEHGYIIGIMSIVPRSCYQQGLPRHFSKFDKFDYYWPSFAHLGEQPIYGREIYFGIDNSDDELNDQVFGYTPRYAEYKHMQSRVCGDFKSDLSFWHLGRIFSSAPSLSSQFVQVEDIERIFAVNDSGATDKFWMVVNHDIKAVRPMPRFGTPTI